MYKASSPDFDFKSSQLLFIYIDSFRMFEKQLVPLHPKYDVRKDDDSFYILKNDDPFYDEDETLDIVAIVGKNGVGKSTFLEILRGRHSFDYVYNICWIDIEGNLASDGLDHIYYGGEKINLIHKKHSYKLSDLCGYSNLGEENTLRRGLLSSYYKEPELFNIHGTPLFDGFELKLNSDGDYQEDLHETVTRHTGIELDYYEFKKKVEEHPTFLILASISQDSTFENIAENLQIPANQRNLEAIYSLLKNKKSEELDKRINKLIYLNGDPSFQMEDLGSNRFSPSGAKHQPYQISQYPDIFQEVQKISEEIDTWIKIALKLAKHNLWKRSRTNLHIWGDRFLGIMDFIPFKKHGNKNVPVGHFSDGEYQQIKTLFDIGPMIVPEYSNWYPFDDCDAHLHPEWSRKYISNLKLTHTQFCKNIARIRKDDNYVNSPMTCLLVTHTPFILSDLTKNSVLRFDKERDENGDEIPNGKTLISRAPSSPFAANIGELLHDDFFMKSTIGEHAKSLIENSIKSLDKSPLEQDVLKKAEEIFNLVGDEILRRLLLEKIRHAKNKFDT